MSDEEKVQILIKMDKEAYECIKNLDNLEEKEGIFPAIEAFNAFVEAVQDGEYVHYEEEKDNTYCTGCPYFIETIYSGEEWHGAYCKKDGHGTKPSMYAIKSLHDDCPYKKKVRLKNE